MAVRGRERYKRGWTVHLKLRQRPFARSQFAVRNSKLWAC